MVQMILFEIRNRDRGTKQMYGRQGGKGEIGNDINTIDNMYKIYNLMRTYCIAQGILLSVLW